MLSMEEPTTVRDAGPERHPDDVTEAADEATAEEAHGCLLNLVLTTFSFFSMTVTVVFADTRAVGPPPPSGEPGEIGQLSLLSFFVGLVLTGMLWARRRIAWTILITGAAAALLLWLDASAALIAMFTIIAEARRIRNIVLAVGVGLVAATASVWKDTRGVSKNGDPYSSMLNLTNEPWAWTTVLAVSVVFVGVVVAIGLTVRSRKALTESESEREAVEEQIQHLNSEVARRAERERIAQEVHDALGHRLTLLSMQAGALEFTATDAEVAQQAASLRQNAKQAMTDLRSLLEMLHDATDHDVADTPCTIDDIPSLVDEALTHGAPVVASTSVQNTGDLDPIISHSAYRVAQEVLTNARKHVPGITVRLNVEAHPASGVQISATNRLPEGASRQVRAGGGLTGIAERARQCGGNSRAWVDEDGVYRVAVWLPWHLPSGHDGDLR